MNLSPTPFTLNCIVPSRTTFPLLLRYGFPRHGITSMKFHQSGAFA